MYSVPLRRALVTGSDLPYPEGVAAAEVLEGRHRVRVRPTSATAPACSRCSPERLRRPALQRSLRPASLPARSRGISASRARHGLGFSLSLALVGAGQLIGISVGTAIFAGLVIAWGIATPHSDRAASLQPASPPTSLPPFGRIRYGSSAQARSALRRSGRLAGWRARSRSGSAPRCRVASEP